MGTLLKHEEGWRCRVSGTMKSNPKLHLAQLCAGLVLLPYALLSAVDAYRQDVLISANGWDLISNRFLAYNYVAVAMAADPAAASDNIISLDDVDRTSNWISITQTLPFLLCSLFISYVSVPALTVSFCRAYLVNVAAGGQVSISISVKASLAAARKAWKSLFLTYMCAALAGLGLMAAFMMVVQVNIVMCRRGGAVVVEDAIMHVMLEAAVGTAAATCLSAAWSLSGAVAVLEGRPGWEALSRSAHLVLGRKPSSTTGGSSSSPSISPSISSAVAAGTRLWSVFNVAAALCLVAFHSAASLLLLRLLAATANEYRIATSHLSLVNVCLTAAAVALRSSITLVSTLATLLLYMSCRAHHQESLETLFTSMTID